MSWPPPPDLDSLKELFATADVEGLIADDCPADEYDPEAKHFYEATQGWATADFTIKKMLPLIDELFTKQFMLTEAQRTQRKPAFEALAGEIARFFGPEARPRVRGAE